MNQNFQRKAYWSLKSRTSIVCINLSCLQYHSCIVALNINEAAKEGEVHGGGLSIWQWSSKDHKIYITVECIAGELLCCNIVCFFWYMLLAAIAMCCCVWFWLILGHKPANSIVINLQSSYCQDSQVQYTMIDI